MFLDLQNYRNMINSISRICSLKMGNLAWSFRMGKIFIETQLGIRFLWPGLADKESDTVSD